MFTVFCLTDGFVYSFTVVGRELLTVARALGAATGSFLIATWGIGSDYGLSSLVFAGVASCS